MGDDPIFDDAIHDHQRERVQLIRPSFRATVELHTTCVIDLQAEDFTEAEKLVQAMKTEALEAASDRILVKRELRTLSRVVE